MHLYYTVLYLYKVLNMRVHSRHRMGNRLSKTVVLH